MGGGEIAILRSDILERTGGRVDDLDIAGHISIAPNLTEVVEVLVSDFSNIELVVPYESLSWSLRAGGSAHRW